MNYREEVEKLLKETEDLEPTGTVEIAKKEYCALVRTVYRLSALVIDAEKEVDHQRSERWGAAARADKLEEEIRKLKGEANND